MNPLTIIAASAVCTAAGIAAEPFSKTIISVTRNLRVEECEIRGEEVTPGSPGWSVKKVMLHGGKQEGVDVIHVSNGRFQFSVIPTRGMGVLSVTMGDVRLGCEHIILTQIGPDQDFFFDLFEKKLAPALRGSRKKAA